MEGFIREVYMRRLTVCMALLVFLCCLVGGKPSYAFPRNKTTRTIETEHFRINYHAELHETAVYLAKIAEQIYKEMVPLLEYEPNYKTEIFLTDYLDTPNGFVNVYPYNWMVLYAVPPDRKSVLNDYDDWQRVLLSHEMTHIIALDTKSGVPAAINHILGGYIQPNQYMPRWYTEGMAVYEESRFSAGGRERSSLFEMFLRVDSLDDNFMTIDQIGGSVDQWPYGSIPYLYGAKFMQYLADKYGEDTFAALGYLYGQRVIAYSLNEILRKVTDDDYVRLYDEWREGLFRRYKADAARLEALGLTKLNYITNAGEDHDSPRFFPSGDRILYFHNDEQPNRKGWAEFNIETGETRMILEAGEDGGADIAPDGRRIVTAQLDVTEVSSLFYDLFLYDIDRNESRQLTHGLRAREPSFAPDGRRLAFVQYTNAAAQLMILDVDSGDTWEAFPKDRFDQVFSPAWSPDGRYIAFTGWNIGGFKDIYLYDLEEKSIRQITDDHAIDMSPNWSPDNSTLYWSSDRTGIYNAYSLELATGKVMQLTNVVGGVFAPIASPDGTRLFVSSYHSLVSGGAFSPVSYNYRSNGWDLAWVDLELNSPIPEPETPEMRPRREYDDPDTAYEDREYSPFPSLYPKIWMPTMGEDFAGGTYGIRTWGSDIARQHFWQAEFDYGIKSKAPTLAFSYSNYQFISNLHLRAAHVSYTLKNAAIKNKERIDQSEAKTSGSLAIGIVFQGRELREDSSKFYYHAISFGTYFRHTRLLNRYSYEPLEPAPRLLPTGLASGFSLTWNYQSREGHPGFISTAAGRSFFVTMRSATRLLGSTTNNIVTYAGYAEYIPNPWVDDHTLALRLIGGIGATEWKRRRLFYLGGPPERDLVNDIVREERLYGYFVRGYEPMSVGGNRYILLKSEYRFSIWRIERGLSTLPLFFRRVYSAPFLDAAYAWSEGFNYRDIKKGVGAELRLDFTMGYFMPVTLRIGYQVGLDDGGISSLFFALDNVF